MKAKKALILSILILVSVGSVLWMKFHKTYPISLPATAKVVRYTHIIVTNSTYCKITFQEEDLPFVMDQIQSQFGLAPEQTIPRFKSECYWWDAEKYQLVGIYLRFCEGFFVKSVENYAVLTKDDEGQYILYFAQ